MTGSMCLCSKSFRMCQWRQWLPKNFDWLSSYCATSPATGVSFLPRWMWRCSVLYRSLPDSFHKGGSECSVWRRGVSWLALLHKGQSAPLCSLPVYVSFLHQASYHFRAERDACVWASVLPFPPFRKQREEKRVLTHIPPSAAVRRSVHPSIHWVSAHTVISTQWSWL